MFRLIGRHFRNIWKTLVDCLAGIMDGNSCNAPVLKNDSINKLVGFFVCRLILWGVPGIVLAVMGQFAGYLDLVFLVYASGVVLAWFTDDGPEHSKPVPTPPPVYDALVEKRAREGLDNLLDIIFVVVQSLAPQTTGQCPPGKWQMAHPNRNDCIQIRDGVAIVTVVLYHVGEIDAAQFLARFNDRMGQMLHGFKLPGHPDPVFIDKANVPHTAIQAIHCTDWGDYLTLEVIRVTEEAIPMLDALDRAKAAEPPRDQTLYDDGL